jgi:hypothetical protein
MADQAMSEPINGVLAAWAFYTSIDGLPATQQAVGYHTIIRPAIVPRSIQPKLSTVFSNTWRIRHGLAPRM